MLDGLVAESEKAGLEINIAKTTAMFNFTGEKIKAGGIDQDMIEE